MAAAEHTVTAMQFAGPATFLAVAARTVLVDPEAAEAYLTRLRGSGTWFGQLGERLRTGAGKGRLPVAPLAERAVAWAQDVLPGLGPVFAPQPPPGWARAAAWEQERRAVADEVVRPGAGQVGRDGQGTAAAGPAVRPGRTGLAARRAGGLRPGHPDLHHPAPVGGGAAPDRPGSGRRAGGPGRAAGRRARAVRAGRGVRRAARLGGQDLRRGGHPPGGGRGAAGRGAGRRAVPAAAPAAVRGDADAGGRRGERRRAALHPAAAGRRAGRDVLVQHRAAHPGDRLGPRGGGLPRGGARAPPAAVPAAAAHRPAGAAAPAQPVRVLRGVGPVRGAARRGGRALRRRPRPARRDQLVADAGGPAGGGHRPARVRLEPGAGPGLPGRSTSPCRGRCWPPRSTGTW